MALFARYPRFHNLSRVFLIGMVVVVFRRVEDLDAELTFDSDILVPVTDGNVAVPVVGLLLEFDGCC